jgi:DNA-binding NtrC family response regulator
MRFGRHGAILVHRRIEYDRRAVDNPGASILVVEDDAALRMVCRVNLELEGFRVREAGSVDEARSKVAGERPGLVLLDLHLTSGPSDDLLDELRGEGIPVVLVSGTVDVASYEGRASAVLPKPFEPMQLVELARRHVDPVG